MSGQVLTEWIKAGYPYLKGGIGLPLWLLPEGSLGRTADELGDNGILKMSRPIGLDVGIGNLFNSASAPAMLSAEDWQNAVIQWPSRHNARPVIETLLEVVGSITGQLQSIRLIIDPMMVSRSLAVLAFAPFIPQGKPLLEEIAAILGRNANEPSTLIMSYAEAVVSRDVLTVEQVNDCIVKYRSWVEWAAEVQEQTLKCRYIPKLVAVTPPLSAELADVLASMIKEGQHDEPGRDYPECPGIQVYTQ